MSSGTVPRITWVGPLTNNHPTPAIVKLTAHSRWICGSLSSLIGSWLCTELTRVLRNLCRRKLTPDTTAAQIVSQDHTPQELARQRGLVPLCCRFY